MTFELVENAAARVMARLVAYDRPGRVKTEARALLAIGDFERRARLATLLGSSVIDDRRLADAIAAEEKRGQVGHWAFDVNRLLALRGHRLARRYELALDSRDRRAVPTYYDCGICGHCHNVEWNGDCREDARRHTCDDLDARFGPDGWRLVPMEDVL
jgi:hypothetical protein